jgi:hypothetical protein
MLMTPGTRPNWLCALSSSPIPRSPSPYTRGPSARTASRARVSDVVCSFGSTLEQAKDGWSSVTATEATSGVFTGTITGLEIDTPANNDAFTYYMIDTTKVLAIETDPNQLTLVRFVLQQ